nr:hypothetical protein CJLB15_00019 [Campylobacter phage CJLB-15]
MSNEGNFYNLAYPFITVCLNTIHHLNVRLFIDIINISSNALLIETCMIAGVL